MIKIPIFYEICIYFGMMALCCAFGLSKAAFLIGFVAVISLLAQIAMCLTNILEVLRGIRLDSIARKGEDT